MEHYEFLLAAERKYAIALARYEAAEQATETIVGLKALAAADLRIQAERKKLREEMERITVSIRRLCDPDWTPGHIKPLHLRKSTRRAGDVSKMAYRIMREQQRMMGSRELAKLVAPRLGVQDAGGKELLKLDVAIRNAFERRVQAGQMVLHEGRPMRWSIRSLAAPGSSASVQPTAVP